MHDNDYVVRHNEEKSQRNSSANTSRLSFPSSSSASARSAAKRTAEETIRVCVRVRPLNRAEQARHDGDTIQVYDDGQTMEFNAPKLSKRFTYDFVMDHTVRQEEVFEFCRVKELIEMALQGYSTTILTYGQTGSGKTFTIMGQEDKQKLHGIVPRAAEFLYHSVGVEQQNQQNQQYQFNVRIRAQYLEIYNETVNDLLNLQSTNLTVRRSNNEGFYVENLYMVECRTIQDLMAVVEEGNRNRHVASHKLNKDSSRSHSILTVYIDMKTVDLVDGHSSKKFGKIHFVDLAGSERLKESKSSGETAVETAHINKSLLTLGKVVSLLGSSKRNTAHVPFRESKLTQLLMNSIGGGCKTILIACLTPSAYHADESLNTLKYASRAKKIKNKPVVNMDPQEALIAELRQEIQFLREQLSANGDRERNLSHVSEEHASPDFEGERTANHKGRSALKLRLKTNLLHNQETKRKVSKINLVPISVPGSATLEPVAMNREFLPSLDPQYAHVLAENERLEHEVREMGMALQNELRPKQSLGHISDDGILQLQKENRDLKRALQDTQDYQCISMGYEYSDTFEPSETASSISWSEIDVAIDLDDANKGQRNAIFFCEQSRLLREMLSQNGISVHEKELHELSKQAARKRRKEMPRRKYRVPKDKPRRQPELAESIGSPPLLNSRSNVSDSTSDQRPTLEIPPITKPVDLSATSSFETTSQGEPTIYIDESIEKTYLDTVDGDDVVHHRSNEEGVESSDSLREISLVEIVTKTAEKTEHKDESEGQELEDKVEGKKWKLDIKDEKIEQMEHHKDEDEEQELETKDGERTENDEMKYEKEYQIAEPKNGNESEFDDGDGQELITELKDEVENRMLEIGNEVDNHRPSLSPEGDGKTFQKEEEVHFLDENDHVAADGEGPVQLLTKEEKT